MATGSASTTGKRCGNAISTHEEKALHPVHVLVLRHPYLAHLVQGLVAGIITACTRKKDHVPAVNDDVISCDRLIFSICQCK